ncbi:GTP cyclohydrolase I [uncultured Methanobrevibacter sp.]|uniref:GTP cyclohydrolase I n=1 Tax=uncultured Methanobrevibacter sp. TaxID=253161 RepID=UPI0026087721|nr:GTP cyclohydrolase I [uncultured Methanobrevibacter sp.]
MINQKIIEQKIGEILEEGLGLDWRNNPHLKETPERVAKVYKEIYEGYNVSPIEYIKTFPIQGNSGQQIVIGPIKAYSTCSHHMLPFSMEIYIGYIPNSEILGISKFERIIKNISHKLQVQENITEEIANFIYKQLHAKGVIVLIKNSKHLCMEMRGVESRNTQVTTSSIRGVFLTNPTLKNEFLNSIK